MPNGTYGGVRGGAYKLPLLDFLLRWRIEGIQKITEKFANRTKYIYKMFKKILFRIGVLLDSVCYNNSK